MLQRMWKTVQKFLKILNIELSYDLAIPLLGIYPREMKTKNMSIQKLVHWDFPGGPVAKTSHSRCRGPGFHPWSGNQTPQTWTSLVAQTVKHLPTMWKTRVQSLGQEDLLEKEMATHSSILAWRIPWMEEPCRLQSMGSQRVRRD